MAETEGEKKKWMNVQIPRGDKSSNVAGTLAFVGTRGPEPLLQFSILKYGTATGIIRALGGTVRAQDVVSNTGIALIDNLQLSPHRLALVAMAIGASFKQCFWKIFIGQEAMSVSLASVVGVYNAAFNTVNSLLFLNKFTSAASAHGEGSSPQLLIGGTLFTIGVLTELISEIQRKNFKDDPNNKGKPHTTGLFGLARNINYAGYGLWRGGFALAAGGWAWGAFVGGFFFWDFYSRAVPEMEAYCSQRYADMWKDYKEQTPYVLIPGLL